ncbi:hypothetical protein [Bacteroides gallinarum]|uniref:hypothetical protein n=1 Tax=Bacteroides gallinarum TaxID=376806 RepID=UPI000369941E|nr:hypothetical protein [Bacteroides gallinarum]
MGLLPFPQGETPVSIGRNSRSHKGKPEFLCRETGVIVSGNGSFHAWEREFPTGRKLQHTAVQSYTVRKGTADMRYPKG